MDLTAIRKAIADNARTADGLEDCKHWDSGTLASPSFWVEIDRVQRLTMGRPVSLYQINGSGKLFVQGTYDRAISEQADRLVDLVWAALETDRTLGGTAADIEVLNAVLEPDPASDAVTVSFEFQVEAN